MVTRLAGEVTGTDTVLQNHDAVSVEAPDDRPTGPWSEAALGDTGLVLDGGGQRPHRIGDDVERVEGRDRIERFERGGTTAGRRGDGDFLVDGRQSQYEVDQRLSRGLHGDGLSLGSEMLTLGEELIGAGGNVLDDKGALPVGECRQTGTDDEHHGPVDGTTVVLERHLPADRTAILSKGSLGDGTGDNQHRNCRLTE